MHIVIRCKECNHKIPWPVEKPFIMERCPGCDVMFSTDADLIDGIADKISNQTVDKVRSAVIFYAK